MKYYKLNDEVYAFKADGSQDNYIKPEMVLMTDDEVDRHIHPENYLTEAEQYDKYLKSLRPLTRRQFKLILLDNGLLDDIEAAIAAIEDIDARRYIEIEYQESTQFERLSPSVGYMCQLLNLDDERVNEMWEMGLIL